MFKLGNFPKSKYSTSKLNAASAQRKNELGSADFTVDSRYKPVGERRKNLTKIDSRGPGPLIRSASSANKSAPRSSRKSETNLLSNRGIMNQIAFQTIRNAE